MGMKVEYINPFIESAIEILRQTTGMSVERGTPTLDTGQFNAPDLSVVLGIVGDMQGQVIFGIELNTAHGIVGRMLGGVEVKELDELGMSAIAELGNMITGNATGRFEKMKVTMDISPPTVLTGQGVKISWPLHRALVVPLNTEVGDVTISVNLEENKDKKH
ncbi:MAG: chemotaxis protein CheX [Candidatus Omnitrophica bacterium]|nr:chemotaxis protein CheX [Candidatus Omnitrophota bacterium]MCA9434411.1 chemotaxis protein CheX [Candidatus Omnitrophota bacterium]MCA9445864.1 chemotaxis protein CheX [Candidatus Omnitrophota bacterium]MCB9766988.1 chemotaxis protein CheX [Candidatus Omnitrophota bacterium]MCB9784954.1 chemotaxis protein CheX [Candidatus Omnitrophota bacterium]